jgi:hypothetical protein
VARFSAWEIFRPKIFDYGAADTSLAVGGADDGYASWAEDEIERKPLRAQDIVRGFLDEVELVTHSFEGIHLRASEWPAKCAARVEPHLFVNVVIPGELKLTPCKTLSF